MANYHLEEGIISRGKGDSVTAYANYITSELLYDSYFSQDCDRKHEGVSCYKIMLPENAPPELSNLQKLCDSLEMAEHRWDSRTARTFIGSLPNELPLNEQVKIVEEFISDNIISHGLCAVYAIHEGKNIEHPEWNNPHVHIIVSTRQVTPDGFSVKKYREFDKHKYIEICREQWTLVQNKAYERNGLEIRVSHESLDVQGVRDRKPTKYISRTAWKREIAEIRNRNKNLQKERKHEKKLKQKMERSRFRR